MGNKKIIYDEYMKARDFVKDVECANLPRNKFGFGLQLKKDALRDFGYNVLYGKDGEVIDLDECSSAKITGAYFKVYDASKKKVALFEGRVACSDSFRDLVSLIDSEVNLQGYNLEEAKERTAIVMDSATDLELELLTRKYGRKVLGKYAVFHYH